MAAGADPKAENNKAEAAPQWAVRYSKNAVV